MVKVMGWIRWVLLALLLLIVLLFVAAQWLLHQEITVQYGSDKLQQLIPELRLEQVQGTLAEGVSVASLLWDDGETRVSLRQVQARLRLRCLFSLRVCLAQLSAAELEILMAAESAPDNAIQPRCRKLPRWCR